MMRPWPAHGRQCAASDEGRRCDSKQVTVHVPRQSVWDFLWDVPRLTACVPGCEAVEEIEPNTRYQAVVRDKVGPF